MTMAEMTPSVVQKTYIPSTGMTGTPMRLVKYTFKTTKTTDGDWIVLSSYMQSGVPICYNAVTIDASNNGVFEGTVTNGLTFTNVGKKLTLSGGTVGTTYGEVIFEEAA